MKRMKQQSKQKQEVLCEHFLNLETHMNRRNFMQTFFFKRDFLILTFYGQYDL